MYVDTTKQTTLLDKKATVANGNTIRKGNEYKKLFFKQEVLVDSLKKQVSYEKSQNFQYEFVKVPSLEKLLDEIVAENKYVKDNSNLEIMLLESEVKVHKSKKWDFGIYGVVVGALLTLASFLLLGI